MRENILLVVGAAAALLLQIVLAPNIAIMGAMPNFVLVYVGIAAMLRQTDFLVGMAFAAGLVYDFAGTSMIGVMAALLTVAAFVASRAGAFFNSDTLTISLALSMATSLLVEVLYALFYVMTAGIPLFDALLMRALPCALYDCAMAIIIFPLLSYLFSAAAPSHTAPQSSTVRLR